MIEDRLERLRAWLLGLVAMVAFLVWGLLPSSSEGLGWFVLRLLCLWIASNAIGILVWRAEQFERDHEANVRDA
jgi:hypothetical protein